MDPAESVIEAELESVGIDNIDDQLATGNSDNNDIGDPSGVLNPDHDHDHGRRYPLRDRVPTTCHICY